MSSRLLGGDLILRGLAIAVLAIAAGVAGYLTRVSAPLVLPPAHQAAAGPEVVRGTVQSRSATALELSTDQGVVTLRLGPGTAMEELRQATLASLRADDWLNAGGVPHQQTLFALTALVVIPRALLQAGP